VERSIEPRSPNAESFVRIGSHVESETVVCIIEAMKLMNEIPG
jgi:biotin carboxyl carrier protein